ncbi:TIGR00725 family protein [Candidatus Gracilibacteria bacterium]|jgi:uncharacterized protein (TIGR00725 family)|nr:TIGR00725 family protein [Candidatus Gracilibacteria bacterium]NJM87959.1 TIGR00725 family protein [Hydrococcus sp. RU_2_2]NJP19263.1 TIGR00725 family protein [Hydrococcus sp. CRU_1_1]
MRKILIGVMGPGEKATPKERDNAYQLGQLIAQQGWVLLSGGRNVGVMDAASKGAKASGGLTVGILPNDNLEAVSEAVDIAIATDMGNARNNINVLSCRAIVACGMGLGTASEVALALKAGKSVILLTDFPENVKFFTRLAPKQVFIADNPETVIEIAKEILRKSI